VCWWIVAGLGALTVVLGFLTTTEWALGTAGRVADQFRDTDASRSPNAPAARDEGVRVVAG
jgi:hypothetical protein